MSIFLPKSDFLCSIVLTSKLYIHSPALYIEPLHFCPQTETERLFEELVFCVDKQRIIWYTRKFLKIFFLRSGRLGSGGSCWLRGLHHEQRRRKEKIRRGQVQKTIYVIKLVIQSKNIICSLL